jgi:hypothetical protein
MKTMKKYQTGSEVKGSKGAKASQIIAGISAAAAGAAGIGKNISNRRKAKKAAEEKAKMEASGKMKYGGTTKAKYQDGGASFKDIKKSAKQDQKLAKITAKTDRIKAGTEPTAYEKAATITGNVAKTAGSAADIVKAVKDKTSGSSAPGEFQKGGVKTTKGTIKKNSTRGYIDSKIRMTGPDRPMARPMMAQKGGPTPFSTRMTDAPMTPKEKRQAKRETNATMRYAKKQGSGLKMQKGGAMSDVKAGVKQVAKGVSKGVTDSAKNTKKVVKAAVKATPEYKAYKAIGSGAKKVDDAIEKRYPNYTKKGSFYDGVKSAAKTILGYKTGGMVNPNATVKKQTVAGSKGVKSGVNPKAAASNVAKGRTGGTSAAPKTATPKAKMGGMMRMKKK